MMHHYFFEGSPFMYYPLQIPYLLDSKFSQDVIYKEYIPQNQSFILCYWSMDSIHSLSRSVNNIVVTDGCIDLVVDFTNQEIGFSGMSETVFDFPFDVPSFSFGARLMPGAFHQLTGLPATAAMDQFLPLQEVWQEFDHTHFFSLDVELAKTFFRDFLEVKTLGLAPSSYTTLFSKLSIQLPATAQELYRTLFLSARQCQRNFLKHYGLSPKKVLSIIRFQSCLLFLTTQGDKRNVSAFQHYYDQPHFINDFKKHIGLTPTELLAMYEK